MKQYLFSFILISVMVAAAAGQSLPKITVKRSNLVVDRRKISPDWILSDATGKLGSPDRNRTGYNNTYTYDRYGIVIFEPQTNGTGSGKIAEFQVHFIPESNEIAPLGAFDGVVKIDKLKAGRDLSKEELFRRLSGWHQSESYIEHSYRLDNGTIYIYFQFTDDEKNLKKMSIGPHRK